MGTIWTVEVGAGDPVDVLRPIPVRRKRRYLQEDARIMAWCQGTQLLGIMLVGIITAAGTMLVYHPDGLPRFPFPGLRTSNGRDLPRGKGLPVVVAGGGFAGIYAASYVTVPAGRTAMSNCALLTSMPT